MRIAIYETGKAWLPEISAYGDYFEAKGCAVEIVPPQARPTVAPDVEWRFPGTGCGRLFPNSVLVHDYPSPSVSRFGPFRDRIKRFVNAKPDLRLFLDERGERSFGFRDGVPVLHRPMGVHRSFFDAAKNALPTEERPYDFVYIGKFAGRSDAKEAIQALSRSPERWKILVIGIAPEDEAPLQGVTFQPPVPYAEVPRLATQARYGLVLTQRCLPHNDQDSTKCLEYAAAGLGLIAFDGPWIRRFAAQRNANIFFLEEGLPTRKTLEQWNCDSVDVSDLEWNRLLDSARLFETVSELVRERSAE